MRLGMADASLLRLLQLVSPSLPVGAYSYSEGLETLVDRGKVNSPASLEHWLSQELCYGAVRLETAVMIRAFRAMATVDLAGLYWWNNWLSAARETEELRLQSRQMGRSLLRLLQELQPTNESSVVTELLSWSECNFAIAFGVAAATWHIALPKAAQGYLHSWASNLVSAGVKLVPFGQTAGQQLLLNLHPTIEQITAEVLTLDDEALASCGWGLALASMAHETQYSRLFRS